MSEEKRRTRPDHIVEITELDSKGLAEEYAGVWAPEDEGVSGGLW